MNFKEIYKHLLCQKKLSNLVSCDKRCWETILESFPLAHEQQLFIIKFKGIAVRPITS